MENVIKKNTPKENNNLYNKNELKEKNINNNKYSWQEDIFDGQREQEWWDNQDISYEKWSKSWINSLNTNK